MKLRTKFILIGTALLLMLIIAFSLGGVFTVAPAVVDEAPVSAMVLSPPAMDAQAANLTFVELSSTRATAPAPALTLIASGLLLFIIIVTIGLLLHKSSKANGFSSNQLEGPGNVGGGDNKFILPA